MVFGRRRAYTAFLVVALLFLLLLLSAGGEARARNEDKDGGSKEVEKHGGGRKGQTGGRQDHHANNNNNNDKKQKSVNGDNRKGAKRKDRKGNKHEKQGVDGKEKNEKSRKADKKDRNKKKKEGRRQQHGRNDHDEGRQFSMSTDVPCGPGRGECPFNRPCCSQWGYCGNDANYCLVGCQEAFGRCHLDAPSSEAEPAGAKSQHHHHHKKSRLGFNLQDKRRQFPNQDGRRFRIPATTTSNKLPPNGTLVNIAYFPGWTQYRGQGRNNCHQRPYLPSSISWSSLDYVMFAFVYFDDFHQLYPADASDEDLYFEINRLKLASGTRVMISIGGWSFTHPDNKREASTMYRFENMIRSPDSRRTFIESCIEFCQFYGFDGVDIDYEYPAYKERGLVTALFKEMREAFDREGSGLVLSLAGASFQEGIQGFEMEKVAAYADFVMIMSYDLYGAYDAVKVVNIHTALIQMPTEKHSGHSVQGAIEMYLDHGVLRNKIVVGLALYGKTFVLSDTQHALPGRATFRDGGDPTSCIETRGDMAYNELASLIHPPNEQHQPKAIPLWDNDGKAFYFVYGNRRDNWVGYDDRPSLDLKLQMVTELDLAGVMWWSLDQDLDSTSDMTAMWSRKRTKGKDGKKKLAKMKKAGSVQKRAIPQAPYSAPIAEHSHEEAGVESSQVLEPVQAIEQAPSVVDIPVESSSTADPAQAVGQAAFVAPETIAEQGPGAVKVEAATPGLDRSPAAALTAPQLPAARPIAAVSVVPGACPQSATTPPPASLAIIPLESLGRPGLVPYVASKRKRCPVVVKYPVVLPEAPVGNTVVIKCVIPPGCPETWQAYTCLSAGDWSAPSPCYGKAQLSPSLYFYGELELVRTQSRDRNIDDGSRSASSAGMGLDTEGTGTGTNKMRSQIGPTRPQYIEEYQKLAKLQHLLGKAKGKEGHRIGRKKKKSRSPQKDRKKMMKMKKAINVKD
ncbi:hypothetical protein EC957_011891 [Mortierella hygrophila]|uniref:Chitinase n=1 Tax=Mortierella hygrophila TaxID=979708 RepID=A0A9P6K335_9FUNG|nr:hypothetical protein EC957_011891 [Mortierella hygrophila]